MRVFTKIFSLFTEKNPGEIAKEKDKDTVLEKQGFTTLYAPLQALIDPSNDQEKKKIINQFIMEINSANAYLYESSYDVMQAVFHNVGPEVNIVKLYIPTEQIEQVTTQDNIKKFRLKNAISELNIASIHLTENLLASEIVIHPDFPELKK